jgi:hypothetical protein
MEDTMIHLALLLASALFLLVLGWVAVSLLVFFARNLASYAKVTAKIPAKKYSKAWFAYHQRRLGAS